MQTEAQIVKLKGGEFEALQYDGTIVSAEVIKHWARGHGFQAGVSNWVLSIYARLGMTTVDQGDWVVKIGIYIHVFHPKVFVELFEVASQ